MLVPADRVRVALDLDEDALRIGLQLGHHLVDARLRLIGQLGLAELEVPLVFAQHHLVHEPPRCRLDRLSLASLPAAAFSSACVGSLTRLLSRLAGRVGLRVDLADAGLVLLGPLLRLFDLRR